MLYYLLFRTDVCGRERPVHVQGDQVPGDPECLIDVIRKQDVIKSHLQLRSLEDPAGMGQGARDDNESLKALELKARMMREKALEMRATLSRGAGTCAGATGLAMPTAAPTTSTP